MTYAAIILAAGASSRMGAPKPALPCLGGTLLSRAVETALSAKADPVVVVLGAHADALTPLLAGRRVTVVNNQDWQAGPGTSLRVGVAALPTTTVDAVVVLLADQPLIDADHLQQLATAAESTCKPMAATGYGGTVGVPALFTAELFGALGDLPPERGAQALLRRDPARVAVVPNEAAAVDLDTPADYDRWTASEGATP